ncbi:hypothetical protein DFA_04124 [Cavenderia fasciculata]|uniref:Uncharacterized protein n=1 Tax=Cavenderia fasciculata TaxID=261658 RepID=F4Q1C8_CACFS|nr:uncharacterized protein DFA_04124 [Cavenderia fasciculata]EGG18629.1 hypothetical protein DFA_04124 [Cavenderia fasciculata]|eukprot:XP_004366533.1 hypothetical protein DFA_04124 [Cavenderia fasciculata]
MVKIVNGNIIRESSVLTSKSCRRRHSISDILDSRFETIQNLNNNNYNNPKHHVSQHENVKHDELMHRGGGGGGGSVDDLHHHFNNHNHNQHQHQKNSNSQEIIHHQQHQQHQLLQQSKKGLPHSTRLRDGSIAPPCSPAVQQNSYDDVDNNNHHDNDHALSILDKANTYGETVRYFLLGNITRRISRYYKYIDSRMDPMKQRAIIFGIPIPVGLLFLSMLIALVTGGIEILLVDILLIYMGTQFNRLNSNQQQYQQQQPDLNLQQTNGYHHLHHNVANHPIGGHNSHACNQFGHQYHLATNPTFRPLHYNIQSARRNSTSVISRRRGSLTTLSDLNHHKY